MSTFRLYFALAALAGFSGVGFGAFGAHALREQLAPQAMSIYKTAVDYQMWHALALAMIAMQIRSVGSSGLLLWAARFMSCGIILFSGSLYALSMTGIHRLGLLTPFGGTAFLVGWLMLGLYACRYNGKN